MKPFKKCPVCGGEIIKKDVEKILKGGGHTAALTVSAQVCLHCGERLYNEDTVRKFESIRLKLEREKTREFTVIGKSYALAT